jgi:hypothetical protein
MERLKGYAKKCHILRQIMSNKAQKYRHINAAQNMATVVVSSFLLFIGFSGTEKIQTYINWFVAVDSLKIEFAFNVMVFVLFVVAILHLVFQFGRKQADAERAIVTLTNLANQIDDLISKAQGSFEVTKSYETDVIRQKYEAIIQVIPANSDSEFLNAKKDYQEKVLNKDTDLVITAQGIFEEEQRQKTLRSVVQHSENIIKVLKVIQTLNPSLYLGGGLVRNMIWDYLHGFSTATPVDDVDVIYFDKISDTKDHDRRVESELKKQIPNLKWSVKNQARMHAANQEAAYESFEEAISKWPETATAIAIRLDTDGSLEIVAPYGLSDLFRLLVRPTPHFKTKPGRIIERATTKAWKDTWPNLEVVVDVKNGASDL